MANDWIQKVADEIKLEKADEDFQRNNDHKLLQRAKPLWEKFSNELVSDAEALNEILPRQDRFVISGPDSSTVEFKRQDIRVVVNLDFPPYTITFRTERQTSQDAARLPTTDFFALKLDRDQHAFLTHQRKPLEGFGEASKRILKVFYENHNPMGAR